VAEKIGGIPSLTAVMVVLTGMVGAVLGSFVFNALRVKSYVARGFAIGLAAHGQGVARAFIVNAEAGAAPRVTVRAADNLLPVITTEVVDRRLVVGIKPQTWARTRNKMVVVVEFAELTGILVRGSGDVDADRIQAALFEIVLRGSGDVKIERLEADALALSITGSGDVTVGGSSRALGVDIFGSGDVRADRLESRQVAVRIRGSGDARVHAVETLQVEISGSGDVRYRGTPQIQQKISGSGELLPLK